MFSDKWNPTTCDCDGLSICIPSPRPISYVAIHLAALFTIAKTWKPPKCPSTEEWIKKMWYIYTRNITQGLKKKNEIMPFAATWMDLEIIVLSEVR